MHLFDDGFRPFFLGAAAVAALQVVAWIAFLTGNLALPEASSPVVWHGREMVFGFAAALVAGFLLTAVANWTDRPVTGQVGIAVLFLLWLAGRVAPWLGLTPTSVMYISAAFLPVLALVIAVPIVRTRNARNYPVLAILLAFALSTIALATTPSLMPLYAAVDVLTVLMLLVGARIIPFFTGRRLPDLGVRAGGPLALATVVLATGALSLHWVAPGAGWVRAMHALAGVSVLACLVAWRSWRVLLEPMLWILHAGYAWLGIGFLMRAAGLPGTAALHAITVGALGCLAIGMMTRVALGHTGRELRAGALMTAAFVCMLLAAPVRLVAPVVTGEFAHLPLAGAALLWSIAFALYFIRFVPVMINPRR